MRTLLALALTLVSTTAFAHTGHGETTGLVHGFIHPAGGADHLLSMLAVGVLAVVLRGRALYLVPLSFLGMMAAGFLVGAAGIDIPFVELGIALSSVVIGAVAASGRSMPVAGAMGLVAAFAVCHGHAHGAEMPAGVSGLEYALGFVAATALLHAAGIAGARAFGRFGAQVARIAGGIFALGGVGVLAGWI